MDSLEVGEAQLIAPMESLRSPAGAFRAAATTDYDACWLRDHLYTTFAYWYIGDYESLRNGIGVAFDLLYGQRAKLERVLPPANSWDFLHAKYNAETLGEVTRDWGHHQLDALGLLLHIVADLDFKHITAVRHRGDRELLQALVNYLLVVRYWEQPDAGMWEVGWQVRSSSVGAIVRGLSYLKDRQLVDFIPDELIALGKAKLASLLPNEFPGRACDLAQLSLIWPYNIVSAEMRDEILRRIDSTLIKERGLIRFESDDYFEHKKSPAQWPMGFFWRSIVASQMNDASAARQWFGRGIAQLTPKGEIPELYQESKPIHSPLAWAHALAIIALCKLKEKEKISAPPTP